ncbi:hypothetical protein WA026_013409 [Henosepilachna vigintioctopunctata]|uniref:Uncharacterized protein n=1 Tax=Henosepilachna vigintioctopunctata TaxID=420089 RepID=A0AAW1V5W7_9CUCU
MPVKGQDLLSLCAVAAENEHLIVTVGKFALNMALSPNRAAYGIAKNIAGLVYSGIASKKQENHLTPTNSRYNNRRVSAGDFIQNEMNGEQKQKLINRISNVLGNKNQNSFSELLSMIINNPKLRSIVLRELKKFLESEKISCSRSKTGGCCCNDDDDDTSSEEDDSEDDDDYYDAPTCCSSRSKSCSRY